MTKTISQKLSIITENIPLVYDAGVEAGKKIGQAAIWDLILGDGERTDFGYLCRGWLAEYIHPPYKIVPTTNNSRLLTFSGCRFLKRIEKEYFDFSQCPKGTGAQTSYYYTFSDCPELEVIEDIGINNAYVLSSTFTNCRKLHTIECIYPDADTTYQNTFANCNSLVYLRVNGTIGRNGFDVRWSTKLSKESIISIVNALSATTSGLTVTLSLAAVNKAFEETANDGSTTLEWLTLVATRPNWTIALA